MSDTFKLLIIEDDQNLSEMIGKALDGLVDSCSQVDNWDEAFAHIEKEGDDAAWIDLRMPKASVEESVQNIAKLRAGNQRIIIIVGSGFITPYVRAQLSQAGVDGCFYKSAAFKAEQVAALIVLGMMRAKMRTPTFNDKFLQRGLALMAQRYPNVAIP